jgi:hypothetical protein
VSEKEEARAAGRRRRMGGRGHMGGVNAGHTLTGPFANGPPYNLLICPPCGQISRFSFFPSAAAPILCICHRVHTLESYLCSCLQESTSPASGAKNENARFAVLVVRGTTKFVARV